MRHPSLSSKNKRFRELLICSMLTLCLIQSEAQSTETYIVLKVRGSVVHEATGKLLKTNDVVLAADHISFGTRESVMIVISSKSGRLVIKPEADSKKTNELLYFIQENALPVEKFTSTRASNFTEFESISGLKSFLQDTPLVLLDTLRIQIPSSLFGFNAAPTFTLRCLVDDDINPQQMLYRDNELVFVEASIPKDALIVQLYAVASGKNEKLADLRLITPDEDQLAREVAVIRQIKGKENPGFQEEVGNYISSTYGYIDEASLSIITKKSR